MPLRATPKGLFLHVRATPKAGRNEVTGIVASAAGQKALGIKVTAAPDKGKANEAVAECLAEAAGVAKSSLRLASGQTSREKVFEVMQNAKAIQNFIAGFQS